MAVFVFKKFKHGPSSYFRPTLTPYCKSSSVYLTNRRKETPHSKEERSQAGSRLGKGSRCFSPGISVERTKTQ